MEYGFFHHDIGYWQTNTEPSEATLSSYPDGTVQVPIKPGYGYAWDGTQWQAPAPDVEALRAAKNAAITARRVAEDQRFQFGGKWFQADLAAWKQISGTHGWVATQNSLPPGFPGWWKAEDNTYTAIPDVPTWWQFYGAVLARGAENMVRGETLKAQLAAATTPEEVEAVPVW